jgi:hypothetical protein
VHDVLEHAFRTHWNIEAANRVGPHRRLGNERHWQTILAVFVFETACGALESVGMVTAVMAWPNRISERAGLVFMFWWLGFSRAVLLQLSNVNTFGVFSSVPEPLGRLSTFMVSGCIYMNAHLISSARPVIFRCEGSNSDVQQKRVQPPDRQYGEQRERLTCEAPLSMNYVKKPSVGAWPTRNCHTFHLELASSGGRLKFQTPKGNIEWWRS